MGWRGQHSAFRWTTYLMKRSTQLWLLAGAVADITIACSMAFLVCYILIHLICCAHCILEAHKTSTREINPFYHGLAEAYPIADIGNECCYRCIDWKMSVFKNADYTLFSRSSNRSSCYGLHSARSRTGKASSFLHVVSIHLYVSSLTEYQCECNTVGLIPSNQETATYSFHLSGYIIGKLYLQAFYRLTTTYHRLRAGIATVSWYSSISEHITSLSQSAVQWAHWVVAMPATVRIQRQYSFPQCGSMTWERWSSWTTPPKLNRVNTIARKTGKIQ